MKVEQKKLKNSIIELTIEEDAKKIAKFRTKAISNIRAKADIKGFRKGAEIPEEIIVKHFWEAHINALTVEFALDKLYGEALRKTGLIPVAQAEIQKIESNVPLKVIINIEVLPEVKISEDYKKIKLKKQKVSVKKEEVEAALEEIQTKFAKFEEVSDKKYKVQMWDKVKINTDGYDKDGKLMDSTTMKDFELTLGSNMLVPGFEESIVWHIVWEEFEEDVTFPKDYHNTDFAGKKTKFKITINSVSKTVKPEFTKEFIKDLRWKDLDLEGFKKLVEEEILDTKISNSRMKEEEELIWELLKVSEFEIGPKLLENQVQKVFKEISENLAQSWAKVGDYIKSLNLSEEEYLDKHVAPIAKKRLEGELILTNLKDIKKIEVSQEEIDKEIKTMIARFEAPDVIKRLKELYVPWNKYYEELILRITFRKLIDSFFE